MRPKAPLILTLTAALSATALSACGGGSGSDPDTVKVSFKQSTDNDVRIMDNHLARVKKQFEKANPGKKVELIPIKAPDADYYTKVQQMMRSPKTAPDLVYEDTFLINSDITAGLLRPLDEYLKEWKDWGQFVDTAKEAVQGKDGSTYAVPDGTDTRGLWFNRDIFAEAGLPTDWQPKSWEDILSAARTIKKKVPDTIPLNVYVGKGPGERSAMQGFEMLLYGTGENPLYEPDGDKWVKGSQGFRDTLEFLHTLFDEDLGPKVSEAVDPNVDTRVVGEWLPEGKLAIDLDGSWLGNNWIEGSGSPWPEWDKKLGWTAMPTQHGQAPGKVSLSGGWSWAIPDKAGNPDLAFEFIKASQTTENAINYNVTSANIAVREDVASSEKYLQSMPGVEFFTSLVEFTHYRPTQPAYPQVSTAIQEASEAVTAGGSSPEKAAKDYDKQLESITDGAVVSRR